LGWLVGGVVWVGGGWLGGVVGVVLFLVFGVWGGGGGTGLSVGRRGVGLFFVLRGGGAWGGGCVFGCSPPPVLSRVSFGALELPVPLGGWTWANRAGLLAVK